VSKNKNKKFEIDKINGIQNKFSRIKQGLKNFFMDVLLINQQPLKLETNEQIIKPSKGMQQKVLKTYDELLRERGYKLGRTLGSGSYAKVKYVAVFFKLNIILFKT
jgi:hypothetical protein